MISQFLKSDVIFQLCVLSLWLGPFFEWFCVEKTNAGLRTVHDEVTRLCIKWIPREVHGTCNLRLDRHGNVKSRVPARRDSTQAKACLVVEKASTLNALLGVSDRNFRRPELIKKICVQDIIGRGGWVIDEDSVVFPVVGDDVTCMQCEVCV